MKMKKQLLRVSAVWLTLLSALLTSYSYAWIVKKPTESAEKVHITYTADRNPASLMPIRLLESIQIWPAADESNITHYNVYWGDSMRNKLGLMLAPRLAKIPARGDGQVISYEFPPNLKMEAGALWVLVCSANKHREFCGKAGNMAKVNDNLWDFYTRLNSIKQDLNANDESSCPGFGVMETCGDLSCNGTETAQSCPSDCSDYKVASFNYQVLCDKVQEVYHPTSIAEIKEIIARAAKNNQHVKVVGGAGYKGTTGSASGIVCNDGIVIVADKITEKNPNFPIKLEMFEGQQVVNAPAGTNLHDLGEWLYERELALGFTHLGWRGVTVAGAIGTSAHGSSPKHSNILSHRVVAMDIINPKGELKTYSRGTTGVTDPDLWKAMTTHLGYFGVITRARLEVEKAQNVQVKVTFHDEKELFEANPKGSVYADIKDCDYGQYNWFPTLGRYLKTCGKVTTQAAEDSANNRLINPYIDLNQLSEKQTLQTLQLGACQPEGQAHKNMAQMRINGWHLTPPLVKNVKGELRYTSDAIGPVHRMTSSELIKLDREVFQMDWEVAVPHKNMQAALEWVREFTQGLNEKNRDIPVPLIGIFVRFSVAEDETLMAYTGTGGDFVEGSTVAHIEMPIYVPVNLNEKQMQEYIGPYEQAMATLIRDFGARGHWGKNQYGHNPWLFELQREIGSYNAGDRLARFSKKVGEFDPKGMFANRQAKVIGIKYPQFSYPADW